MYDYSKCNNKIVNVYAYLGDWNDELRFWEEKRNGNREFQTKKWLGNAIPHYTLFFVLWFSWLWAVWVEWKDIDLFAIILICLCFWLEMLSIKIDTNVAEDMNEM